jgi:hypothetical protein
MLEVCAHYMIEYAIYFLSVRFVDMYLSKTKVYRNSFQLLGCVCISIAADFLGDFGVSVSGNEMVYISDNSFSLKDFTKMKTEVHKNFGEKPLAAYMTVHDYVCRRSDIMNNCVGHMALYMICIAVRQHEHLNVSQSTLADICVDIAYSLVDLKNPEDCNMKESKLYKIIKQSAEKPHPETINWMW